MMAKLVGGPCDGMEIWLESLPPELVLPAAAVPEYVTELPPRPIALVTHQHYRQRLIQFSDLSPDRYARARLQVTGWPYDWVAQS